MRISLVASITLLSTVACGQTDTTFRLVPMKHKLFEPRAFMATLSVGFADNYRIDYAMPMGFQKSNTSGNAPFFVKLEHGLSDHISLAGTFGYDAFLINFNRLYDRKSGAFTRYIAGNTRILSGTITAYYHLTSIIRVRHLDPFIGIGMSLNNIRYGAYPIGDSTVVRVEHTLTPSLKAGARYYITNKFSLYGDVGYDRSAIVTTGVSIRFMKKQYYCDHDRDGVPDYADSCLLNKGLAKFHGCPDSDNDGIRDSEDSCVSQAGSLALHGCPDSDGDGITDNNDACPHDAGSAQFRGCPDTDQDGIADHEDACPVLEGTMRFNGCPDSDGDGISDNSDKCPSVFGSADNHGCPSESAPLVAYIDLKVNHIEFQSGKAVLTPASYAVLYDAVNMISAEPGIVICINGYADITGTVAINKKISLQRAMEVKKFFIRKGIASNRIVARGYGSSAPIGDNRLRSGRARNRRVEMKLDCSHDK